MECISFFFSCQWLHPPSLLSFAPLCCKISPPVKKEAKNTSTQQADSAAKKSALCLAAIVVVYYLQIAWWDTVILWVSLASASYEAEWMVMVMAMSDHFQFLQPLALGILPQDKYPHYGSMDSLSLKNSCPLWLHWNGNFVQIQKPGSIHRLKSNTLQTPATHLLTKSHHHISQAVPPIFHH